MVSVVTVRSKLYLNIIGYTPRVGNNTTAVNKDDALYVFTRTSWQKGLHFSPKGSQQNIFKALRFSEVTLLRCRL